MNNIGKNIAIWLIIGLVLMTVFNQFSKSTSHKARWRIPSLSTKCGAGPDCLGGNRGPPTAWSDVARQAFRRQRVLHSGAIRSRHGRRPAENNVRFSAKPEEEQSLFMQVFIPVPDAVADRCGIFFMRQMQGGGKGRAFSFGKSRARMLDESSNPILFADVAGCDEAKEEVAEMVEFLRDPSKFQRLGGRIPRGVLLVGSPGTGKTLLAKAIAGEGQVPFFSISGSDFVEMFVGVGAARVRDMFEQAQEERALHHFHR